VKTLDELLQDDETSENSIQDCSETMNQTEVKVWTMLFDCRTLVDREAGASELETFITQYRPPAQGTITRSF
jgi:hypothetical protein